MRLQSSLEQLGLPTSVEQLRIKRNDFLLDSSLMIPNPCLNHFSGWCLSRRENTFRKPDFHLFSLP